MKNSIIGCTIIFLCILSISAWGQKYKKNETRIIVQFHQSSFSQYLGQYIFNSTKTPIKQPFLVSQITSDEIIIKIKERITKNGLSPPGNLKDLILFRYENLSLSDINVILSELNRNPLIEYAELDEEIRGAYDPSDTFYNGQWNMKRIGMDQVWEHTRGEKDIIVAVLDTGIDYTHPDLFQSVIPGYDFCNDDDDPYDDTYDSYHGTHIAGTIVARGNNSQGIAGMAWNVKVMPLKILDHNVAGYWMYAVRAIDYAIAHDVSIINASWGYYSDYAGLRSAIERARDAGIIFVAAAGNGKKNSGIDTDTTPYYPASYNIENIISVANTDNSTPEDILSCSSNFGLNSVDLAAPGVSILSTIGQNRYQTKSGTSMAAPHVSGAAAIIKSVYPKLSYLEIISAILSHVDPLTTLNGKVKSGGRLNVINALTSINGSLPVDIPVPEDPPSPTPEPVIDLILKYQCMDPLEFVSNIPILIKITNRDINPMDLSEITLRYYYTKEGTSEENVVIDFATIQATDIIITIEDRYLEIGFSKNAGILNDTDSVEFQLRFHMLDYSNYNQFNDHSFNPLLTKSPGYNIKITMYVQNELIWGYGPDGQTPTPTPFSNSEPTPEPTRAGILGDVNSDGITDILDALLVLQFYVGLNPQEFNQTVTDVNCDDSIDIIDALLISQYYVGLISSFC